jgi:hypothetical protein
MNLQQRVDTLALLGEYLSSRPQDWQEAAHRAFAHNNWFTPEFTDMALTNITGRFLKRELLSGWASRYGLREPEKSICTGIVMAGNIPMVGFHDLMAVFLTGHRQAIKVSSKDNILIPYLVRKLEEISPASTPYFTLTESLKGCDAYIATGSNNSARYFEYYFSKYPHIIRSNKTSLAVLTGEETDAELSLLSDDIMLYFGLGCRNVTKLLVPDNYDFGPLLEALKKYDHFREHHKYMNNYDYRLAILLLNQTHYFTNGTILICKDRSAFSPISMLHYETYSTRDELDTLLDQEKEIQCIVGKEFLPFGQAQSPSLTDYADGVDTMAFLITC